MLQEILVLLVVLGAVGYVGRVFYLKSRTFSTRSSCGANCGCSNDPENSRTAH
ncbi:MAG: FeoB-associated Cys-rich membrane protein [Pyrinomonadaceae bacterium]